MLVPDIATHSTRSALRDEPELIARIRAGDESACEALYVAYFQPLWKFAYAYVRSAGDAEEIVQDVFLALWRDRARWHVHAGARAWLYAAVRHRALNHVRHERVVARMSERRARRGCAHGATEPVLVQDAAVAMGAPAPDAQATVEAQELDEAVRKALASLPERRRLAMMLRWKHDLAPAEIAAVLGTTPASVRVLLTRARQELALLLGASRR